MKTRLLNWKTTIHRFHSRRYEISSLDGSFHILRFRFHPLIVYLFTGYRLFWNVPVVLTNFGTNEIILLIVSVSEFYRENQYLELDIFSTELFPHILNAFYAGSGWLNVQTKWSSVPFNRTALVHTRKYETVINPFDPTDLILSNVRRFYPSMGALTLSGFLGTCCNRPWT